MIFNINFKKIKLALAMILTAVLAAVIFSGNFPAEAAEVKTVGESLVSKVAPGEFLPVSVKLLNFGSGKKVDVEIEYKLFNKDNAEVFAQKETVAVETTASFVKNIQIPYDLPPGRYTAKSSIVYAGQEVPATSAFPFTVEKKIFGVFAEQFLLYGIVLLLVGLAFAVVSRLIMKRRASRFAPHDYRHVEKQDRVFYEIISDIVMQARCRVGDRAVEAARKIEGLEMEENGKIIKIEKDPAEIVTLLMIQYEKLLGRKITPAAVRRGETAGEDLGSVEKNLNIVKKYFK